MLLLLSSKSNDIIELYLTCFYEFILIIWDKFKININYDLINNIKIYKDDKKTYNNKIRFKMMDLIDFIDKN